MFGVGGNRRLTTSTEHTYKSVKWQQSRAFKHDKIQMFRWYLGNVKHHDTVTWCVPGCAHRQVYTDFSYQGSPRIKIRRHTDHDTRPIPPYSLTDHSILLRQSCGGVRSTGKASLETGRWRMGRFPTWLGRWGRVGPYLFSYHVRGR